MTSVDPILHTEVYQAEHFEEIAPKVINLLKITFKANRIIELSEDGNVEKKLLDDCVFGYDGLEHLYTNQRGDFMLYFSHEDSVTAGGEELLSELHKLWPEYKSHFWADSDTFKILTGNWPPKP